MCLPFLAAVPAATAAAGVGTAAAGAATAAAGMSTMQMLALGASALGAVTGIYSSIQQANAAEATAKNNARMAEYAAQDAERRGQLEAQEIQRRGASLKSAQRVSLAAKGLDLGYGLSSDLQEQTDFFTQSDMATARTNAAKEAWNNRAQGAGFSYQAEAAHNNARLGAAGSLLSTAGAVADRWYAKR